MGEGFVRGARVSLPGKPFSFGRVLHTAVDSGPDEEPELRTDGVGSRVFVAWDEARFTECEHGPADLVLIPGEPDLEGADAAASRVLVITDGELGVSG
jgi:hypothetical protein